MKTVQKDTVCTCATINSLLSGISETVYLEQEHLMPLIGQNSEICRSFFHGHQHGHIWWSCCVYGPGSLLGSFILNKSAKSGKWFISLMAISSKLRVTTTADLIFMARDCAKPWIDARMKNYLPGRRQPNKSVRSED